MEDEVLKLEELKAQNQIMRMAPKQRKYQKVGFTRHGSDKS